MILSLDIAIQNLVEKMKNAGVKALNGEMILYPSNLKKIGLDWILFH